MSIHASKGMEFNTVFLIGCYDGSLPSNRDDADPEEERRLLYVAITRAREHLFISYPQSTGKSIEPNQASRFLRKAFSMP
jgi:DNA helicase-2/ATP-dependent DNA helicase PcrA